MPQMGQMPPMMMPPMPMGAPSAAHHPAFQNLMQTESKTQSKFVGAPLLNIFLPIFSSNGTIRSTPSSK